MTPVNHRSSDNVDTTSKNMVTALIDADNNKKLSAPAATTNNIPAVRRHFQTTPIMVSGSTLDDDSIRTHGTSSMLSPKDNDWINNSITTTTTTITTIDINATEEDNNQQRKHLMLQMDDNSIVTTATTSSVHGRRLPPPCPLPKLGNKFFAGTPIAVDNIDNATSTDNNVTEEDNNNTRKNLILTMDDNSITTTATSTSVNGRRLPPPCSLPKFGNKFFAGTPIAFIDTSTTSDHHHITQCETMPSNNISSDKQSNNNIDDANNPISSPSSPSTMMRHPWSRSMSEGLLIDPNNNNNNNNNVNNSLSSSLRGSVGNNLSNSINSVTSALTTDTSCFNNNSSSRHSLRHTVTNRRQSLTHQEALFLEELIRIGNDIDIQIAYETLLDEDLFFNHPSSTNNNSNKAAGDDNSNGIMIDKEQYYKHYNQDLDQSPSSKYHHKHIPIINEASNENNINEGKMKNITTTTSDDDDDDDDYCIDAIMSLSIASMNNNNNMNNNSFNNIGLSNLGSERRQSLIIERKNNNTASTQMWKAHENGLAVSHSSSRRSVLVREIMMNNNSMNSSYSNSRSRRDLSLTNNNNIYRSKKRPTSPLQQQQLLDDIQSDNNRRRRHSSFCITSSSSSSIAGLANYNNKRNNSNNNSSVLRSSFASNGTRRRASSFSRLGTSSMLLPPPTPNSSSKPSLLRRLKSEANIPTITKTDDRLSSSINSSASNKSVSFANIAPLGSQQRFRTTSDEPANYYRRNNNNNNNNNSISNNNNNINGQLLPPSTKMIQQQPPVREDSEFSIPSLHKAYEVLSSTSSIPSLQLANGLLSPDGSTLSSSGYSQQHQQEREQRFPSIHLAHVFSESVATQLDVDDDDDYNDEEKKTNGDDHNIPYKVSIQPTNNNKSHMIQDATTKILDSQRLPSTIIEQQQFVPSSSVLQEVNTSTTTATSDDDELIQRAVILRCGGAVANTQEGVEEGIEVADWETEQHNSPNGLLYCKNFSSSTDHNMNSMDGGDRGCSSTEFDIVGGANNNNVAAARSWYLTNSFDDSIYCSGGVLAVDDTNNNTKSIFRRVLRRTLSDESNLTASFRFNNNGNYNGRSLLDDSMNTSMGGRSSMRYEDSNPNVVSTLSWKMEDDDFDDDDESGGYDAWKVIEDEYANGYGGGGTLPFLILGTSADDIDAHPHVLSPPLMESLLSFMPPSLSNDNLWMKYSLVRDGASLYTLLQKARGSKYTFLAIETIDGEVFGSFTASPWRKSWNYFGSHESFLWKMKQSRRVKSHSIIDQAQMESEIEVYPYTGTNDYVQLCTHDRIAVGGGYDMKNNPHNSNTVASPNNNSHDENTSPSDKQNNHHYGYGLTIENDCIQGTTSPCITFSSPSLSTIHSDGSMFEIMNLELWTLTPAMQLEDAEKLELSKLFLEKHSQ